MRKSAIFVFCVCIALFACRKDIEKPSWDTEILAPLVSATLNVNNLLPDSLLQANADSSLKIVYQNDIYKLNMDTLFKIPDTILHNAYFVPGGLGLSPGTSVIPANNSETTYPIADAELKLVVIQSGKVHYKIKSTVHAPTIFYYSIPCATKLGIAYTLEAHVPAAVGSSPGVYEHIADLSGYTFDMTGIAHNKVNTIFTSLAVATDSPGPTITTSPGDSLVIDNTFEDIIPYLCPWIFRAEHLRHRSGFQQF
jgi:hypothetical protein